MAKVQNNSSIKITRSSNGSTESLGNKLFNGYIYSLSLEVGYGGEPNSLTIHLALNKTLKNVKSNTSNQIQRKRQLESVVNSGTSSIPSSLFDSDFNVEDQYLGISCSYDIHIQDSLGNASYSLVRFKIVGVSISKKNNEKILTLTLHDNSIILNKIFVGILGQHIAIDDRSIQSALAYNIVVNCPETEGGNAGNRTLAGIRTKTHVPSYGLGSEIYKNLNRVRVSVGHPTLKGLNFLLIESNKDGKTLENGYGAVIIVGEEEYKYSECEVSESTYSFNTLLGAMDAAKIKVTNLRDKSQGGIKRSFSGTLREVLNQWCSEYSYSYVVDFSYEGVLSIIGIDLASSVSEKTVLQTKLNLELLEFNSSNFVIKSQDFAYDLSQRNLKLYSSIYHKEAKNKMTSYESELGNVNLQCIQLPDVFPMWFANGTERMYDFSGSSRSYYEILTSAVLGKFSPKLRQIYNYQIGAFLALGFRGASAEDIRDIANSKIKIADDAERMFEEGISSVLQMQAYNLDGDDFNDPERKGKPAVLYDFYLGLYNQELVNQVEKIENFIVDFIGAHYWTQMFNYKTGSSYSENSASAHEVSTDPSSQRLYEDQIDTLPIFKQLASLTASMAQIYDTQGKYFEATKEFRELKKSADDMCKDKSTKYIEFINNQSQAKNFRFYTARSDVTFSAYQELIKDLEILTYSIHPATADELNTGNFQRYELNLADIFAPDFKELSPVSLGLLSTIIPIQVLDVPMESFKFGIFTSFKKDYQIFNFAEVDPKRLCRNEMELQHQIRRICQATGDAFVASESAKLSRNQKQNLCNKTLVYTYCILPYEINIANEKGSATTQSMIGPSPESCLNVVISRAFPILSILKGNLIRVIKDTTKLLLLDPQEELDNIHIHTIQDKESQGVSLKTFRKLESKLTLVCPSQADFPIRLVNKTSSEASLPAQQFVAGGLESRDVLDIVESDSFGVEILLNNVTPNVRETFDRSSETSTTTQTVTHLDIDNNLGFQFLSFKSLHDYLSKYFNSINLSSNSPKLSYSAEIFCSSVSKDLKSMLSVANGLSKLAMTLGEGGLNIQCSFDSRPARPLSAETLIMKNKPNIKLINTYWKS